MISTIVIGSCIIILLCLSSYIIIEFIANYVNSKELEKQSLKRINEIFNEVYIEPCRKKRKISYMTLMSRPIPKYFAKQNLSEILNKKYFDEIRDRFSDINIECSIYKRSAWKNKSVIEMDIWMKYDDVKKQGIYGATKEIKEKDIIEIKHIIQDLIDDFPYLNLGFRT